MLIAFIGTIYAQKDSIQTTSPSEEDYSQNTYTIRYFQPDGEGELKLDDGTVLLPNDRYPLERGIFRLYYTSHCDEQQSIDIYIEDSFGQIEELSFCFQDAG